MKPTSTIWPFKRKIYWKPSPTSGTHLPCQQDKTATNWPSRTRHLVKSKLSQASNLLKACSTKIRSQWLKRELLYRNILSGQAHVSDICWRTTLPMFGVTAPKRFNSLKIRFCERKIKWIDLQKHFQSSGQKKFTNRVLIIKYDN